MRGYQSRGSRAFGGMGITPGVKLLMISNAVVFGLQTLSGGGMSGQDGFLTRWLAFMPHLAIQGLEVWRFFTYMFLHGDFIHIAINMFVLWMFGSQIEARWGRNPFLVYYVICGLGGAMTYGLFNLAGADAFNFMLGASGAVYGILLAYGLTFPNSVILIGFLFPMKAKYAVLLFGLIELTSTAAGSNSGIAHLAHLGGMLTGFIFLKVSVPSLGAGTAGNFGAAWRRMRMRRRMRVVRPGDEPRRTESGESRKANDSGTKTDGGNGRTGGRGSDVDLILDKISREGLQSLTPEEQDILRRAGRR